MSDCKDLQTKTNDQFLSQCKAYEIEESGWDQQIQFYKNELSGQLQESIHKLRDREIEKLKSITEKVTHNTIEEIVSGPLYDIDDNFWDQINSPY